MKRMALWLCLLTLTLSACGGVEEGGEKPAGQGDDALVVSDSTAGDSTIVVGADSAKSAAETSQASGQADGRFYPPRRHRW